MIRSRTFRPCLAATALALSLGALPQSASAAVQATLYASPDGTGRTCAVNAPCTLTEVRDKVREENGAMTGDIIVYLRGGTYQLSAPFELVEGPAGHDSGTNGFSVIYQAYPGETPILSGGVKVTGWTLADPVRNIYRAPVPATLETRQLYVNGVRALRAKGPMNPPGWTKTATGYTAPDATLASFGNVGDVEIVSRVLWKSFRCGIGSVVGTAVTMDQPCWAGALLHTVVPMGLPSWLENAYELLDAPREWYLDRAADFLYYKPGPGEEITTAEVVAPVLEALLTATGTPGAPLHHVKIQGLTFTYATWLRPNTTQGYADLQAGWHFLNGGSAVDRAPGAVLMTAVKDVVFERNRLVHLGGAGLEVSGGSRDVTATGNVITDISSSGVVFGTIGDRYEADPARQHRNLTLGNNDISRTAVEYEGALGVFGGYLAAANLHHNEVRQLPYTGISVGWGWDDTSPTYAGANQLRSNHVHDVMQTLVDGGGIYTLNMQPGSYAWYNFIDNATGIPGGLYHDNGTQGYSSAYNVVTRIPTWLNIQLTNQTRDNAVMFNCSDTTNENPGIPFLNTIASNYKNPTFWPEFCLTTQANAGIEATYQDIRFPRVSISDASVTEGNTGATTALFTVTLGDRPKLAVAVPYTSAGCTATAGSDFTAVSGTLSFSPAGSLSQTISVPVAGDTLQEGNELFTVSLGSPTNATLGESLGVGRIVDNDGLAPLPARADFSDDGKSDLVLRNRVTGDLAAWFLDGTVLAGGSAFSPAQPAAPNWTLVAANDFSSDGKADLLFHNEVSGKLSFWLMNGTARTTGVLVDGETDLSWKVIASADFNSDAEPDLLWRQEGTGALQVWYLDGTSQVGKVVPDPPLLADLNWQLAAAGDLSGDGKPDLLWRHQVSGALVAWLMDGINRTSGVYLTPSSLPDLNWQVAGIWDTDGDRKGDLVWQNATSGKIVTWLMDATTRRCGTYLSPRGPEDENWSAVGPR